jgi:hypothetical protein
VRAKPDLVPDCDVHGEPMYRDQCPASLLGLEGSRDVNGLALRPLRVRTLLLRHGGIWSLPSSRQGLSDAALPGGRGIPGRARGCRIVHLPCKFALVEFVAQDRSAFRDLLADTTQPPSGCGSGGQRFVAHQRGDVALAVNFSTSTQPRCRCVSFVPSSVNPILPGIIL